MELFLGDMPFPELANRISRRSAFAYSFDESILFDNSRYRFKLYERSNDFFIELVRTS